MNWRVILPAPARRSLTLGRFHDDHPADPARSERSLPGFATREGSADFLCCRNARVEPLPSEINPDPAAVVLRQIEGLAARTARFVQRVQSA